MLRPLMLRPFTLVAVAALVLAVPLRADTVTLAPAQDNTLYGVPLGNVSNGKGDFLFAGRTNQSSLRRALLRFDVAAALPPGSTIVSAELRLFMSKTLITLPKDLSLHRVLAAWGEGASNAIGEEGEGAFAEPGDVTWTKTFQPSVSWISPGGDFVASPSATTPVGAVGPYAWSSTDALVADVQLWLDAPQENHGWVLLGDEATDATSKRFNARENPDAASRPALVLEYLPPSGCPGEWTAYGAALAGLGGLAPALSAAGCPQVGGAIALELSGGVGGAPGALFVGLSRGALPFKGGTLLVSSLVTQVNLVLGGAASVPGTGSLSLPVVLPADPVLQGFDVFLQGALQDLGAPQKVSLTAGLQMHIG